MFQSHTHADRCVRILLSALWLSYRNAPAIATENNSTSQNCVSTDTFTEPSRPTSGILYEFQQNLVDPRLTLTSEMAREPLLQLFNRDITQGSIPRHKSLSSIASNEHHGIALGSDHSEDSNISRDQRETEFKPVQPKSAVATRTFIPKIYSKKVHFKKLDDASSKLSLPSASKHSYESLIYNDDVYAPSKGSFDETYAKYYGESHPPYGTGDAFAPSPSKINHHHHHVYTTPHQQSSFSAYENKMKPHKEYYDDYWKNIMYPYLPADHNLVQDGFINQKYVLNGNGHDVNNPAYENKMRRKNSLLGILTALIPLGLLLSALPPRVVIINSTSSVRPETVQQKAFTRKLEEELLPTSDISSINGTKIEHLRTSSLSCIKLKICEAILREPNSSISSEEDYSLWHSLPRYSSSQDIYEAVAQKQCSKFNCEVKLTSRETHN